MKLKCSFILKALTAMVLVFLLLFGTVATSIAAVVDDLADESAAVDVVPTGARTPYYVVGQIGPGWGHWEQMTASPKGYYCYYQATVTANTNTFFQVTAGASYDTKYLDYSSDGWYGSGAYTGGIWTDNGNLGIYSGVTNPYIVTYYPHTELNTGDNPKTCYYNSLPTEPDYLISGDYGAGNRGTNTWSDTTMSVSVGATGTYTATANVSLSEAGVDYTYKFVKDWSVSSYTGYNSHAKQWYGQVGSSTMTGASHKNWTIQKESGNDIPITTSIAGTYIFTVSDTNNWNDTDVSISVTYPSYTVNATADANGYAAPTVSTASVEAGDTTTITAAAGKTGYQFDHWVVSAGAASAASYGGASVENSTTNPITIYPSGTAATVTLNAVYSKLTYPVTYHAGTAGGVSGEVPAGQTKTYDDDLTLSSYQFTRTGYVQDGWATSDGGDKAYDLGGEYTDNASLDLYPHWAEKLTLINNNLTIAASAGGTVNNSGSGAGIVSYYTFTAVPDTGKYFAGWTLSGTDAANIIIKDTSDNVLYDGSDWASDAARETVTIRVYTDGSNEHMTAALSAGFISSDVTVNVGVMLATDGTGYKTSNDTGAFASARSVLISKDDFSTSSASSETFSIANSDTVYLSANEPAGYKFIGWVSATSAQTSYALSTAMTETDDDHSFPIAADSHTYWYAMYKKIYYITAYNSYTYKVDGDEKYDFSFQCSPPRTITATNAQGTTTFTYAATSVITERGEDQNGNGDNVVDLTEDTGATKNIVTSGDYHEGNLVQILAGDSIAMVYSSLSSSEAISSVHFNNDLRYTTELEIDNLYRNRIYQGYTGSGKTAKGNGSDDSWWYDYEVATTLYANDVFFQSGEKLHGSDTTIASVISGKTYPGSVDQSTHTLTFTATQDYRNIDMTLASKRRFHFVDTTGAEIKHETSNDFYEVGQQVGASNSFGVKAGTSDKETYTFDPSLVQFYSNKDCAAEHLLSTTHPTAGVAIATTDADGDTYYNITCAGMPNTDIYVKLNIKTSYTIYLRTLMLSDLLGNQDAWSDVAKVDINYTPDSTKYTYSDTSGSTTASTASWNESAITTVAAGDTIDLTFTFRDLLDSEDAHYSTALEYHSLYSFSGWYTGTSSAPDYSKGLISTRQTWKDYEPEGNTYIYAVGTRDLFIAGSHYLFGSEEEDWVTHRMTFDPANNRYYWEITPAIFEAASNMFTCGNKLGTRLNSSANKGNSFFKIFDDASGTANAFWPYEEPKNVEPSTNAWYGKVYDTSGSNWGDSFGYIAFNTTNGSAPDNTYSHYCAGYDAPIYIYAYPSDKTISVGATKTFPNIYVSNGYKGIDSAGDDLNSGYGISIDPILEGAVTDTFTVTGPETTWSMYDSNETEGDVKSFSVNKKNGTVRISKAVSSASYKVSAFVVYNLATDEVSSVQDLSTGTVTYSSTEYTTYYADFTMNGDEELYIVPIIEDANADMTITVDSSQLDYDVWGDFISCYAWYGNSAGDAYGAYPGQLMIPQVGGKSWVAHINSTKGGNTLDGILFANYYTGTDGGWGKTGRSKTTWISEYGIFNKDDGSTRKIDRDYNNVNPGTPYAQANIQCQTYDYREPVAMYLNRNTGEGEDLNMSFAIKSGNSGDIMSIRHNELTSSTIPSSSVAHTNSEGTNDATTALTKFNAGRFEYLKNGAGKNADLNGVALTDDHAVSYYIVAKGMVYYGSDDYMKRVFYSNNNYDSVNTTDASFKIPSLKYDKDLTSDLKNAVQWYVYDVEGTFITSMLSAGYADHVTTKTDNDTNSLIVEALTEAGYAVDDKAVAIAYDNPRMCYSDGGSGVDGSVNNGSTTVNCYRFSGQWYVTKSSQEITVSVGVGMIDESGKIKKYTGNPANVAGYGSATASYDRSVATPSGNVETGTNGEYVTTTLKTTSYKAVKLTASATNFKGWYIENEDGTLEDAHENNPVFYPGYNQDTKYYAIYEANATYKYNFTGREGAALAYTVSGGRMLDDEMTNNLVNGTGRAADVAAKSPTSFSLFKKTITFNAGNTGNYDNSTPYILNINNPTVVVSSFAVTAWYPDTKGGANVSHSIGTFLYNTAVDITDYNGGINVTAYAGDELEFKGWYTAPNGGGLLLSDQPNFGQVIVKTTEIYAYYAAASDPGSSWHAYIDDNEVTKELYSATDGRYYNDTIIRIRNDASTITSLPEGAEVGVLVIRDDGNNRTTTRTNEELTSYANNANLTDGKTARIRGTNLTVTKLTTNTVTMFNRADLAMRSDYASTKGQKYSVYAYIKIGESCVFSTAASGTYN